MTYDAFGLPPIITRYLIIFILALVRLFQLATGLFRVRQASRRFTIILVPLNRGLMAFNFKIKWF